MNNSTELVQSANRVMASFSYNYKGCVIKKEGAYWIALGRPFIYQKEAEGHIDQSFRNLSKNINGK